MPTGDALPAATGRMSDELDALKSRL